MPNFNETLIEDLRAHGGRPPADRSLGDRS
jgi:hypothetical protein